MRGDMRRVKKRERDRESRGSSVITHVPALYYIIMVSYFVGRVAHRTMLRRLGFYLFLDHRCTFGALIFRLLIYFFIGRLIDD